MTVVMTKRSPGNNKFIPEHLIRMQLHVDQEQFYGTTFFTVSKDDYVRTLTNKGVFA